MRFAMKISPEVYALHIAGDEDAVLALEDALEEAASSSRPQAAGLPAAAS